MEQPYYDKNYLEIGEGDLLKVYHFRTRGRIYYMYQIAVLCDGWWEGKDYNVAENKGHYRLRATADANRVIKGSEIIKKKDWQAEDRLMSEARKRKKLLKQNI